ncbi:MAG: hypothetical protein LBP75_02075 [Planctomycetota bacterium]|jgi:hypothetical protein|nr:hypothetical protein [Planctomycetota bacterium]
MGIREEVERAKYLDKEKEKFEDEVKKIEGEIIEIKNEFEAEETCLKIKKDEEIKNLFREKVKQYPDLNINIEEDGNKIIAQLPSKSLIYTLIIAGNDKKKSSDDKEPISSVSKSIKDTNQEVKYLFWYDTSYRAPELNVSPLKNDHKAYIEALKFNLDDGKRHLAGLEKDGIKIEYKDAQNNRNNTPTEISVSKLLDLIF